MRNQYKFDKLAIFRPTKLSNQHRFQYTPVYLEKSSFDANCTKSVFFHCTCNSLTEKNIALIVYLSVALSFLSFRGSVSFSFTFRLSSRSACRWCDIVLSSLKSFSTQKISKSKRNHGFLRWRQDPEGTTGAEHLPGRQQLHRGVRNHLQIFK